jgi:hypothetical protein
MFQRDGHTGLRILSDPSASFPNGQAAPATFIRGDADGNGQVNLTDGLFILLHLFQGGPAPVILDAADVDDSGTINLTDAVRLLNHLFRGGDPPPAPYPAAGIDPTQDGLG